MGNAKVDYLLRLKNKIRLSDDQLPPQIINISSDFPTTIIADNHPRNYVAGQDVTDNDPTKTNTGKTFKEGQIFFWDKENQEYITFSLDSDLYSHIGSAKFYGGELSINADPTKFNFTAGLGYISNSYTDLAHPQVKNVAWDEFVGVSTPYISLSPATFVALDANGSLVLSPFQFSRSQVKELVFMGIVIHQNFTTINFVASYGIFVTDWGDYFWHLFTFFKSSFNQGMNFEPNGPNLKLNLTGGNSLTAGFNYSSDPKDPLIIPVAPIVEASFSLVTRSSVVALVNEVPVTQYDNNGVLTELPDNHYTAHRLAFDSVTGSMGLQYGQNTYDSMKKAVLSSEKENYVYNPFLEIIPTRTILVIKKNATDLTDFDFARFINMNIINDSGLNTIDGFENFAENIEIIDGMTYQRQAISFYNSGGILYVDIAAEFNFERDDISFANADSSINTASGDFDNGSIIIGDRIVISGSTNNNKILTVVTISSLKITVSETIIDESAGANIIIETNGKNDITFVFGQREFVLNCTTGLGRNGRARIAVTNGSDSTPQENYVSAIRSGDAVVLQQTLIEPVGAYSMLLSAFVPSTASTIADGFYNSRRSTDTKEIDGRGAVSTILSKLRDSTDYRSGLLPTITIDTGPDPDSVNFTMGEGIIREIYNQNVNSRDLSIDGALVVNDFTAKYKKINNANEIDVDAKNNSLNNKYFQIIFAISLNTNGYPDRLLANLPNGSYISAEDAFDDVQNYSVTTFPKEFKSVYLLCAGVFRLFGGNNWTNVAVTEGGVNNIDLRGQPLGVSSSGSGTAAITSFSDSDFSIFNSIDNTKIVKRNASNITTGQTRTVTEADRDLDLANPIFDSVQTDNITEMTLDNGVVFEGITAKDNSLIIPGNLIVNGTEIIQNVETLTVEDNLIFINSGETGAGVTKLYAGLEIDRGSSNQYAIMFNETQDNFRAGEFWIDFDYDNLSGVFLANEEIIGGTSGAKGFIIIDTGSNLKIKGTTGTFVNDEQITGQDSGATADVNGAQTINDNTQAIATREDTPTDTGIGFWNNSSVRFDTSSDITWDGSALTASVLSDGTLSILSGTIVGGVNAGFTGTVQAASFTDGVLSISSGSIGAGAVNGTFSGTLQAEQLTSTDDIDAVGTITGDTITDGTAILNGNILLLDQGVTGGIGNNADISDYLIRFTNAGGAGAADQSYTPASGDVGGASDTWQSFTTGTLGYLTSVSVKQLGSIATSCTVRIYEGEGTGGALLATETGLTIPSGALYNVPLSALPFLENATKYTIRVNGTNWQCNIVSPGSYAGGRFSNSSSQDAIFETYMSSGFDFVFDSANNRVGIGTSTPVSELQVVGTVTATTVAATTINAFSLGGKLTGGANEIEGSNFDIDGGAIDAVTLGTNSAVTEAQIDDININGNTISSTDANGEIYLIPNGTGSVRIGDGNVTSNLGMLVLDGTTGSIEGPHIAAFVSGDNTYPVFQQFNYAHDNIALAFDAYWDGSLWKSADAGSNFQIYKIGDLLEFRYDSGIAQGNNISWNKGIALDTSGNVGIGTASPASKLDIIGTKFGILKDETDREGIEFQTDGVDNNASSRVYYREIGDGVYGASWLYVGGANPTLDGTTFTLEANKMYLIMHVNSLTGTVAMEIDRNEGEISFPAVHGDTVSTSSKILSIQADGKIGESTNATPTFATVSATGYSMGLGSIEGYVVGYSDIDTVTITSGFVEANGSFYTLASGTTHDMTSLASGFDFHYIYIDDSESTAPTAVIIDATTEPAWSDAKRGWYNGDDRCIGVIASPSGSSIINPFMVNGNNSKGIVCETGSGTDFIMGTNMNPISGWQIPNIKDGSAVTPVNATEIKMFIKNSDISQPVAHYLASIEFATLETNIDLGPYISLSYVWDGSTTWVILGSTRNVVVAGYNVADNDMDVDCKGFKYSR